LVARPRGTGNGRGNTESPLGDAIRPRAELSGVDNLRQHMARGTLVNAAYCVGCTRSA